MLGEALQIATVVSSLTVSWLFSKKETAKWGYLLGLLTLPLWIILEFYYKQWFYLVVNPLYIYLWARGLRNHWKR
jgi:hypothetical protein